MISSQLIFTVIVSLRRHQNSYLRLWSYWEFNKTTSWNTTYFYRFGLCGFW